MVDVKFVVESQPIHIPHDTYKRECRYTRGIHIPVEDFKRIIECMSEDTKLYFDFHNPRKSIQEGVYLNGYNGLARTIVNYYKEEKGIDLIELTNGKDFYVKLVWGEGKIG